MCARLRAYIPRLPGGLEPALRVRNPRSHTDYRSTPSPGEMSPKQRPVPPYPRAPTHSRLRP